MAAFLTKHLFGDFVFQSSFIVGSKGSYGHAGGILHVVVHAVLSACILVFLPISWTVLILICLAEAVVHYHIDWAKERIRSVKNWTDSDAAYWNLFGLDQLLHHLTYVAIVAWVVCYV